MRIRDYVWDRGLKIKAGTNDAHSCREKSIKIENTVIIITYLLHPVLNINIAQIFTQMTIIHAVISCLTVSHFNEDRKNESGLWNQTKQLPTNTSTLCDQTKVYHVIIMNSNESSRFTFCHLYTRREILLCAVYLEHVYTSLFNRATATQTHTHTMILSSASCTLTPPCPCKAEPCYNKIQGYTVAQCCQTPSEFHLKDLMVFCSPADMIKLELQLALQQKCTCCTVTATDWLGLFFKNQCEPGVTFFFFA